MTINVEIERFQQDHATPESVMAFFSELGPDASMDSIASVFQVGGYAITLSDLDEAAKEHQRSILSDQDLDRVTGGVSQGDLARHALRFMVGAATGGISELVSFLHHKRTGQEIFPNKW